MKKLISFLLIGSSLFLPRISSANWFTGLFHKEFHVKRFVLPNGLTVLLHEDHFVPVVAVNIWYKVGSKNEEKGKSGFAHLFEHYMFEGSAHIKEDEYVKKITGMGGELNANTTYDRTDYFEMVPSQNLEEVLRMESDRMCCLESAMNPANFEKQRKIVKKEKEQREKQPYSSAMTVLNATVFEENHPYQIPVIGKVQDLDGASLEDVKKFHSTYYVPNNAILAVSGDIDIKKTVAMIQRWFGNIPAGKSVPALAPFHAGPLTARKEKTAADKLAQVPLLVMGYRVPGEGKPGSSEAEIISYVLAGRRDSRLVQDLEYDQRLVDDIEVSLEGLEEENVLIIDAVPAANHTVQEVQAAIEAEIGELVKNGVKKSEVDFSKTQLKTSELNAEQNAYAVASALVESEEFAERIKALKHAGEKQHSVSLKSITKTAREYLKPEQAAVIVIAPAAEGAQ